jgi:hypothetical protein
MILQIHLGINGTHRYRTHHITNVFNYIDGYTHDKYVDALTQGSNGEIGDVPQTRKMDGKQDL